MRKRQADPVPPITRAKRWGLGAAIPPNVRAPGAVSFLTDTSTEMAYPLLPLFLTGTLGAGAAFGIHRAMDHLGTVAGPILAFLLLPLVGGSYRAIFWPASIPAALCVVMLVATVRVIPAQGPPRRLPLLTLRPYDRRFRRFLCVATLFSLGNSRDAVLAAAAMVLLWALLSRSGRSS
jgi:hypothetical protein